MIKAEWTNKDTLDLQPTCNQLATDCISRRDALDALEWTWAGKKAFDAIKNLPSAPRPTGRWVHDSRGWVTPGGDPVWVCSECGKGKHVWGVEWTSYGIDVADHQWVACPNCGVRMEESDGR